MTFVALLVSAILIVVAAVHFLWALGWWFPIRDEAELVKAVVGVKGAEWMPGPIPCALVVAAMLIAAGLPWIAHGGVRQVVLILAATGFVIRGILPWRPFWRKLTPQEPFATYDRRFYGPLCLLLGLGFAVLALENM